MTFFPSVFLYPSFSFLWSCDFCQKVKVKHFLVKKWQQFCYCRAYLFPSMGYFTDTVFQIKRNPDLRHLCHCRFAGTPYGSYKIVSGGRRITSLWWESKENLPKDMGSIFGLPWALSKSDFNFVNTKVGYFLDTCTVVHFQLVVNQCKFKQLWEGYVACEIIQPAMTMTCFHSWCRLSPCF